MACLLLLTAGCSFFVEAATEKQATSDFVGRAVLTELQFVDGGIRLDFDFEGGEWSKNSGICFARATARVRDGGIFLRVYTSVCTGGDPAKEAVILRDIPEGRYHVFFQNPDDSLVFIGEVDLNAPSGARSTPL